MIIELSERSKQIFRQIVDTYVETGEPIGLCGRALDMASMGVHHRLCHALGGLGLPHARTHAIVLPYATAYNAPGAPDAMAAIADSLGAPGPADRNRRSVGGAAEALWALNRALGISDTLSDLGLAPESIERVVEEVMSRPFPNPVPVTAEGIRTILGGAMSGGPPPGAAPRDAS
jgi:maleylacetate reductase